MLFEPRRNGDSETTFVSYRTDKYKLHYLENISGIRVSPTLPYLNYLVRTAVTRVYHLATLAKPRVFYGMPLRFNDAI